MTSSAAPAVDTPESLETGRWKILEMIARGADLPDVLAAVCRVIEGQEPGLLCSILLTDEAGRHTGIGFGPSLPVVFVRALEGIDISKPYTGSCCKALDCGEEVVVCDIEADPRWSPLWRDLNLAQGLRACRSIPIIGSDGTVLASVAVFRKERGDPGPANKQLLGVATHLAGIAIERRRAEERERRLLVEAVTANAKFGAFFDQGPLFAGVMSLDGTIIEANRLSLEACGYTREQVIGRKFWDCPWWSPSKELMDTIRLGTEKAAAGELFRVEMLYFIADGSQRMVDFILMPIKDESGTVVFLAPTGTDITDRKRAEMKLLKSEERMRLLWQSAAVLLTTDDPDTMLRELFDKISPHLKLDTYFNFMVNDSGSGLRLASCTGVPEETVRTIETLAFGQAICGTVAVQRSPLVATYIQQSDDPRAQLVKLFGIRAYACNPLMAGDLLLGTLSFASRSRDTFDAEELEFLQTVCQYVTYAYERLRLIRQLREEDRKKDDFLATLAHELRNPLAPIRNAAQYLKMKGPANPDMQNARDIIERQVRQMTRLVDDLLDISRITRGKVALRRERVGLSMILTNALESSRPSIEEAGHELTVALPDETLFVDGDTTRLAQVFGNLLTNAAKYTDRGGRVWLTAERQGSDVMVSVRDTGIGIAEKHLPRLFDMFSQVEPALERAQGGLGIGLALVKNLVEMHGGSVAAKSDGPGKGSEFIVRLPLLLTTARTPATGRSENRTFSAPQTPRRILIADDNVDSAESLGLMLSVVGHEVRTVFDGLEAVRMSEVFQPDLILLDIGMPKLNGYDAARRIREHPLGQKAMLVALTGWGQDDDKRRSQEAGFDHHFTKPVDPAALERLLAEVGTT